MTREEDHFTGSDMEIHVAQPVVTAGVAFGDVVEMNHRRVFRMALAYLENRASMNSLSSK